jgi:hypothetical protein
MTTRSVKAAEAGVVKRIVDAAMRESLGDLYREGPLAWTGDIAYRMRILAAVSGSRKHDRLMACARLAALRAKKGKR